MENTFTLYILKNPHISVPVQLKPMLFKDQIYCLMEKFLKIL